MKWINVGWLPQVRISNWYNDYPTCSLPKWFVNITNEEEISPEDSIFAWDDTLDIEQDEYSSIFLENVGGLILLMWTWEFYFVNA